MKNNFICEIYETEVFDLYLSYSLSFFQTGFYYLDLIITQIFSHSFVSIFFSGFDSLFDLKNGISHYVYIALLLLGIGLIIDLVFYFLGKYLSKYIKFKFNQKKLFYIFFRFVPIIGGFGVLIGSVLSKDFSYKKDLLKILIGNILFALLNIFFWGIMGKICGYFIE